MYSITDREWHVRRYISSRALSVWPGKICRESAFLFPTENLYRYMHREIDIRNIIIIVMAYYYNYICEL